MDKLILQNDINKTVWECFQEYIEQCSLKNLSNQTIMTYTNHFTFFNNYLDDNELLMCEVNSKLVEGYILSLKNKNSCNDITIKSYIRGLRAFLYYSMRQSYLSTFKIKLPKVDKKIKETYTDEELTLLFKKPNVKSSTFSEYKIWVYSNYLLATGNRISSALNLKIKDLDFADGVININHTKNRKAQIIPLSSTLAPIMREYLKYRKGNIEDYVFCNTYGNKADIRTYQDMLKSYNNKRGVTKTSAHLYRHTFAKKWILNGGDIFRLQKILGHSDLTVVKEYVNMFGNDLTIDFDRFNPLDRMGINQIKDKIKMVM